MVQNMPPEELQRRLTDVGVTLRERLQQNPAAPRVLNHIAETGEVPKSVLQQNANTLVNQGYRPEDTMQMISEMGPGEHFALWGGLGLGVIGLLSALSGNGGVMSLLLTLLGGGLALGGAASGGLLGQGAQGTVQGLLGMLGLGGGGAPPTGPTPGAGGTPPVNPARLAPPAAPGGPPGGRPPRPGQPSMTPAPSSPAAGGAAPTIPAAVLNRFPEVGTLARPATGLMGQWARLRAGNTLLNRSAPELRELWTAMPPAARDGFLTSIRPLPQDDGGNDLRGRLRQRLTELGLQ
jgi:hypothetical protein